MYETARAFYKAGVDHSFYSLAQSGAAPKMRAAWQMRAAGWSLSDRAAATASHPAVPALIKALNDEQWVEIY